jgi:hypothetical protein
MCLNIIIQGAGHEDRRIGKLRKHGPTTVNRDEFLNNHWAKAWEGENRMNC